jgi:hemolysin III
VAEPASAARVKPRLRGAPHELAFYASLAAGTLLCLHAQPGLARGAAVAFAASGVAMFGVSALYHRVTWRPHVRRWLCRADHAAIYLLIAGSYAPCGLLALRDEWRVTLLAVVWSGCLVAAVVKAAWVDAPKWAAAATGIALGAVGVVALPQLVRIGAGGFVLLVAGGALYIAGALVYALRRPDPLPAVFGYHEVFHTLTVAAIACQYVAIGFWVVR